MAGARVGVADVSISSRRAAQITGELRGPTDADAQTQLRCSQAGCR